MHSDRQAHRGCTCTLLLRQCSASRILLALLRRASSSTEQSVLHVCLACKLTLYTAAHCMDMQDTAGILKCMSSCCSIPLYMSPPAFAEHGTWAHTYYSSPHRQLDCWPVPSDATCCMAHVQADRSVGGQTFTRERLQAHRVQGEVCQTV